MTKLALAAAGAFLCTLAPALAGSTYQVDNWPGDIDNIPCSAWQRKIRHFGSKLMKKPVRQSSRVWASSIWKFSLIA